jgi:HK97 family phage prohead protease
MILTPEKRFLASIDCELRVKKNDDGVRTIIGYAAKFGKISQDLGGFREIIDPKAFEKVVNSADVRGLKNHDPGQLLGRTKSGTMRLTTDETGLRYEIDIPNTQIGRDLVTEIERGDIDGSSFSFTTEADGWDETTNPPTRTLYSVRDLFDVGPVTYPAYLDTEASVRMFLHHQEARAQERQREEESRKELAVAAARVRRQQLLKVRLMFPHLTGVNS